MAEKLKTGEQISFYSDGKIKIIFKLKLVGTYRTVPTVGMFRYHVPYLHHRFELPWHRIYLSQTQNTRKSIEKTLLIIK